MSAGPVQTRIIFVGATTDFGRPVKPHNRRHRAQRELWRPAERIPQRPVIDRDLIERMRETARKVIDDAKPRIKAMLAKAA
jgi:hypothetical protein